MDMEEADINVNFSQSPSLKRQRCSSTSTTSAVSSTPTPSPDSTSCNDPSLNTNTRIGQRSLEDRRQHAIVACKNRRGAESGLIQDLAQALPVSLAVLKSCDKVTVLRLATSYLKLRAMMERLNLQSVESMGHEVDGSSKTTEMEALLLRGGFVIIMSTDGEIVYVSENAAEGLCCETQVILGTKIYDHIDEDDHPELDRLLAVDDLSGITPTGTGFKTPRESATVRLRPELTSKRKGQDRDSLLCVTGKVFVSLGRPKAKIAPTTGNFFVGVVEPVGSSVTVPFDPLNYEFPFPNFEVTGVLDFVCSEDMKLVRSELKYRVDGPLDCFAFNTDVLVGLSGFEFVHAEDMGKLRNTLTSLYKHGSSQTREGYRMLSAFGGWIWVVTHAAMMEVENLDGNDQGSGSRKGNTSRRRVTNKTKTKFCFGRNFFISEIINQGETLAAFQMSVEGIRMEEPAAPALEPTPAVSDVDFLDADTGFEFGDLKANPISEAEMEWLLEELELLTETETAGLTTAPPPHGLELGHDLGPSSDPSMSAEFFPLLKSLLKPKSTPSLS